MTLRLLMDEGTYCGAGDERLEIIETRLAARWWPLLASRADSFEYSGRHER